MGFFIKKPEPKPQITKEQTEQRVIWAVTSAIACYDDPPVGPYELIDRECHAMKLFVTDCPYSLQKRDLLIARKMIHKHETLFEHHRFI
jgi:hypothetical protein